MIEVLLAFGVRHISGTMETKAQILERLEQLTESEQQLVLKFLVEKELMQSEKADEISKGEVSLCCYFVILKYTCNPKLGLLHTIIDPWNFVSH